MSSRVHRTSQKYLAQKPVIDRERAVRSHTRRARKHAVHLRQMNEAMQDLLAKLPTMTKPELVKIAKGLDIPRRSRLTKQGLIKAISEVVG